MLSHDGTHWLALGILIVLGVACLLALVPEFRRKKYSLLQFGFYMLSCVMVRVLWRGTIVGQVVVSQGKGAVIVCNHLGPIDPAFIGHACDRQVHWLVAEEFCRRGFFAWCLRVLEAIPATRAGIDTKATKAAIRYVEQGELVGIFPEGRINTSDRFMLPGRPGAALVALKARVPVVPCYIQGSPNDGTHYGFLFTPARARLVVGRPIDLSEYYDRESDREVLAEITTRVMIEIARLAGRDDFEPELAGRRWKTEPVEALA